MHRSLAKPAYGLLLLLIAVYAFLTLRGQNGIPGLLQKNRQIQELERENGDLARVIEQKKERIQRLRESQAEQETEIRQRLKLVQPGEKVYVVPDGEKPAAAPATVQGH